MNKSLQIALLAVIIGLSSQLTAAEITAISPTTKQKVGDVEITLTIKDSPTLDADDYVSFSTTTAAGTGDLKHKVTAAEVTAKSIKKTFKFATAGNYTCIATTGSTDTPQTAIKIEVAGKFLSVSMIIAALFLLF